MQFSLEPNRRALSSSLVHAPCFGVFNWMSASFSLGWKELGFIELKVEKLSYCYNMSGSIY